MHIGKLDKRITVQPFTVTRDAEGGLGKNWSTGTEVSAQVIYERGSETVMHEKVNANARVIFKFRKHSDFTPDRTMRVVYNSTNHNISDIGEIEREGWIVYARVDAT